MLSKQDLTVDELLLLQSELRNSQKNLAIAYLMLLGGHLGLHRFYVKRYKTGTVQLLLFLVALTGYVLFGVMSAFEVNGVLLASTFILIFALPALALFIWVIVDLFLMNRMIQDWNLKTEQQIIQDIVSLRETK
jgi:hypothetical protein